MATGRIAAASNEIVPYVVDAFVSATRVRIQGSSQEKIAFTSQDFLGLSSAEPVKKVAEAALEHYTVGSCGPRGFYGTTKAHLELEDAIAKFMGTPESITYSDALATTASAIPAFSKRGDVLLIDAAANAGIVQGASLSRSKLVYFAHNDMADLERHLLAVKESDRKKKDLSLEQRRFIVVEGIYAATGDLCRLSEVVTLARKYRWRVILDDSNGVGVLGASGRGSVEHHGLAISDVDVLVGSLSTSFGSVGGFCVGSREVTDHQRLSGVGYCFSASAAPFLCAAATAALEQMQANPHMLATLQSRCKYTQNALARAIGNKMVLLSDPVSPVKHMALPAGAAAAKVSGIAAIMASPTTQKLLQPDASAAAVRAREIATLDDMVSALCSMGFLVARSHALPSEAIPSRPTLKVTVTTQHSEADIDALAAKLQQYLA